MGAGGGAGGHRFARRGFGGAGVAWGAQGGSGWSCGRWRGWREARNRHGDRGRACSEMAPGRELKAAGGGAGCPVPERGSPGGAEPGAGGPPGLPGGERAPSTWGLLFIERRSDLG